MLSRDHERVGVRSTRPANGSDGRFRSLGRRLDAGVLPKQPDERQRVVEIPISEIFDSIKRNGAGVLGI